MIIALPLISALLGVIVGAYAVHFLTIKRSKVERARDAYEAACILREQYSGLMHSYAMMQIFQRSDDKVVSSTIEHNRRLFFEWEMTKTISRLVSTVEVTFPYLKDDCYKLVSCVYKVSCLNVDKLYVVKQTSDQWREIDEIFQKSASALCAGLATKS